MIDLNLLQNQLGITFNDISLLRQSLIHRSYLNESHEPPVESNERLEFLGDAFLGFVIAEELYNQFPDLDEGEMTKLRSALVCQDNLARLALSLEIGSYLYLGQGEEKSGGRRRLKNIACAMEAIICAVLIDQGFVTAREFVLRMFSPIYSQVIGEGLLDYKSKLQELTQAERQERPSYRIVETVGPEHDRQFTVEVILGEEILGSGSGKSKRLAEKEAARRALESWSSL
jgi:ribonuclease-3